MKEINELETFDNDWKIRVDNLDDYNGILNLVDKTDAHMNTRTKVLRKIIHVGLPLAQEEGAPGSAVKAHIDNAVKDLQDSIMQKLDHIIKEQSKTNLANYMNQEMNTLMLNLIEQLYIKQCGVELTPLMRQTIIQNVVEPFKSHIVKFIEGISTLNENK